MRIFLAAVALVLALFVLRLTFVRSDAIKTGTDIERTERGVAGSVEPGPGGAGQSAPLLVDPVVEPRIESARVVLSDAPLAVEFPAGRAMLTIRVMSGAKPIAGSAVVLDPVVAPKFVGELDAEGVARTDAGGRARFHLRPSRMVAVGATLPGTDWSATGTFTTPLESQNREVVLRISNAESALGEMEGTLQVLVRSYPSLIPLGGVELRADVPTGRGGSLMTQRRTDAAGRLEVPWRPGLKYVVEADGHTEATVRAPKQRGDGPFTIDVMQHARVWGRFTSDPASGPAAGVVTGSVRLVPLTDPNRREPGMTTIDQEGNWAIESIEFPLREKTSWGMTLEGSLNGKWRVFVREVVVRPGDDLELKDEWKLAPPLEVLVTYGSGRTVGPGVELVLMGRSEAFAVFRAASATVVLDAVGQGTFANVPTGSWPYELRASRERVPSFNGTIVHDGARLQTVVVEGFDSISGRVVDAAGVGQANWLVRLVESPANRAPRAAGTGADGTFHFDFVKADAILSVGVGVGEFEHVTQIRQTPVVAGASFAPVAETTAVPGQQDIELVVEPR